jgi:hypothetical protein
MGKVINKNLITEIEPTVKLGKKNQEVWERIEKLAKEINRLNKKNVCNRCKRFSQWIF